MKKQFWTMGLLRPEDWTAKWIIEDESPPDREPIAPLFRKTFDLPSAPVRATVKVYSRWILLSAGPTSWQMLSRGRERP